MGDEDRRELARQAGDGDLEAARRLVRILERERGGFFVPGTRLGDVPVEAWQDRWNVRTRAIRAIRTALEKVRESDVVVEDVTLQQVASLTSDDLLATQGCGRTTLAAVEFILTKAGLTLRETEYELRARRLRGY
jgi:hypothetical protein